MENILKNYIQSIDEIYSTKMYELSETQALEELKEIKNVVESNWRKLAEHYGLSRSEIEEMAPAFDMLFKG